MYVEREMCNAASKQEKKIGVIDLNIVKTFYVFCTYKIVKRNVLAKRPHDFRIKILEKIFYNIFHISEVT